MTSAIFAILTLLIVTCAAAACGAQVLRLLGIRYEYHSPLDTLVSATLLGYAIIAYLTAAVGLLGLLSVAAAWAIIGGALLLGLWRRRELTASVIEALLGAGERLASGGRAGSYVCGAAVVVVVASGILVVTDGPSVGVLAAAAAAIGALLGVAIWKPRCGIPWLLVTWLIVTMLAALAPPADSDWDGLAEHLAQAKIYAEDGEYRPLWYDHHSHFPALTQMLFTIGMLLNGAALAKLFHWGFGAAGLLIAWRIAERFAGRGAGKWAAACYASTPLIGWLMQVGYVDLATSAFTLGAAYWILAWWGQRRRQHLALAAIMAGAMMATKMQGIALFGVLFAAVLIRRAADSARLRAIARTALVFGGVAIAIAAPWYIKTWATTGNPVYPFAYGVFGGKYWGESEARQYAYHQKEFGVGRLPPPSQYWELSPAERVFAGPRSPTHLLAAPWNLTFNPVPFTVHWRQGPRALLPVLLQFWIGPVYLLSLAAMIGVWLSDRLRGTAAATKQDGRTAGPWPVLLWLFAALWVWWLFSMQLSRYLLPSLVLVVPAAGYAWRRLEGTVARIVPVVWMALALAMAAYIAAPAMAVTCGVLDRETYLRTMCQPYDASKAVNEVVPPDGKVALFGEPRGFYIDREYLWADPGHHRMIPYSQFQSSDELIRHFRKMGITHVLINQAQVGQPKPRAQSPIAYLYDAIDAGIADVVTHPRLRRGPYLLLDIRHGP